MLVAVSIGIGLVSGVMRPLFLAEQAHDDLIASLYHFATTFDTRSVSFSVFFEGIIRYGRILLLILACAALPKARYIALLVLYMRSMALGFSAAMMVEAFDGRGFAAALTLYGLQNLIAMPVFAFITYLVVENRPLTLKIPGIGVAAVFCASAVEAYISPTLFESIWR